MSRLFRVVAFIAAVAFAAPAAAQAGSSSYYPSGPQQDVARSAPTSHGWEVCYSGTYTQLAPLSGILADCD